ncbi:MAG TPA: PmoA family protein, partial [Gemmataceae bacterium]|nr:PmoA family protein [Gemmataceae bacterium]
TVLALAFVGLLSAAEPKDMSVSPARRDDAYRLSLNGVRVATYYIDKKYDKPFLFRLIAPGNVVVTRAWPIEPTSGVSRDHVHQKSAWFTHGEVTLENAGGDAAKPIDFWSEAPGHGKIMVTQGELPGPGKPLRSWDEWQGPDGKKVLAEARSIALFSVAGGRLIVFDTDQHAEFGPVVFGDTKEGAFGVRVDDLLRVGEKGKINPQSRITNADGKQGEKACWGYPSNWCDYSGVIDGKAVGIAIFDDPANKPRSCWHVRDYGLMAANPFGRAKSGFPAMRGRTDVVRLAKDDHLRLRYGIFLHEGDASTGKVGEAFTQFVKLKD